ncbi:hypothetical protein Dsin_008262 [Dipteronia sinensis]|uniref:RNase H type-1 domain-containing protein n=1 Tax=Dipteronia sinensis TaxID=43782 RepID=A0AAE0ANM5_9ROSI|nr:hypothetical protein Dsin_008262 [Dipteronia sinensis]
MIKCRNSLLVDEMVGLSILLWKIWYRKNIVVHGSSPSYCDSDFLEWVHGFTKDYRIANQKHKGASSNGVCVENSWRPLDEGWFKVNSDTAIDGENMKVGIGIIIRNSNGVVMASSTQSLKAGYSHQMAEATAILRGLQFAVYTGLVPCMIESDAQVVINLLKAGVPPYSDVGLIIQDIFSFCENSLNSLSYSFRFVLRKANLAAHCLAKIGLSSFVDDYWMEECPPSVVPVVRNDYSF